MDDQSSLPGTRVGVDLYHVPVAGAALCSKIPQETSWKILMSAIRTLKYHEHVQCLIHIHKESFFFPKFYSILHIMSQNYIDIISLYKPTIINLWQLSLHSGLFGITAPHHLIALKEDVDFQRPQPEAQDDAVPSELLSCRGKEHTAPEPFPPRRPASTASSASSRSSVSNRPPETWIDDGWFDDVWYINIFIYIYLYLYIYI